MCFAKSHGTVSYFKPQNPETNLAKLLLPSLACSVVDAPLVTSGDAHPGFSFKHSSYAKKVKRRFFLQFFSMAFK